MVSQPIGGERFAPEIQKKLRVWLGLSALSLATFSMLGYPIHENEFLSSYGKDFLGPLATWYSLSAVPRLEKLAQSKIPLLIYAVYAINMELLQSHGRFIQEQMASPARYDPWDLVMWGAGTAFALGVNRFITGRQKS